MKLFLTSVLFLSSFLSFAGVPKDEDDLTNIPKDTQFLVSKDVIFPTGARKVFFQAGRAITEGVLVDGNQRFCFIQVKLPGSKERVLEQGNFALTSGVYRIATGVIELQIAQPLPIFTIGCISPPKDHDRVTTIGELKNEVAGLLEIRFPGPEPIRN